MMILEGIWRIKWIIDIKIFENKKKCKNESFSLASLLILQFLGEMFVGNKNDDDKLFWKIRKI
jgi:hypothetical protein